MRTCALVLVAVAGLARVSAACGVAWEVAGVATTRLACRDGDPSCDTDGVADGRCTFRLALCRDTTGCAGPVRVGGKAAATVRRAVEALGTTGACTGDVVLAVRMRRTAVLRASARDAAVRRTHRERLRLACEPATRSGAGRAVVVTTDFETGLLATVGVRPPHAVARPDTPIHSDAVVRVFGERVYVVNRFLGDNLQVLDPRRGLATLLQCSTGPGSNPHDVALLGERKAYVTRYDEKELWVVDPGATSCAGFFRRAVDLGAFADDDGIPEMDQIAAVGDRVFVTVERLDRARRFAPAGRSRLVVLDATTDAVIGAVELTGANAFGDASGIVREPGTGKLVVAEAGNVLRSGDGGLERIDPTTLTPEGFFITEDELGGSVTDFVLASPTKGYAIVLDDQLRNVLVAFDPTAHVVTRRLLTRTRYLPDLALAPDGRLWLADDALPTPGIRIFDTLTDRELTRSAIDVGLPPFSIAFVP